MRGEAVVVTGIGPVTPVGLGVEDFWAGLVKGRSGVRALTGDDLAGHAVDDLPVRIGAPVDLAVADLLPPQVSRRMDRASHLAVVAARLAREDARLDGDAVDPERLGVVIGSAVGGFQSLQNGFQALFERGPRHIRPDVIGLLLTNAAAGAVGMVQGALGPTECVSTACATGAHAVARATDLLRGGHADVVLAGGVEAALTRAGLAAFASARTLSARNDAPELASRPFDVARDGFVLGEGSTVLVLEREADALARGAAVYARVAGIGLSGDAHHYMAPHPEGRGAELAMRNALRDAGLGAGDIAHVNAHATSTSLGDRAEARALRRVFGDRPVPVYAPKASLGHLLGAAGTTEIAASALSLRTGTLPGTLNLEQQEPDVALNVSATTSDVGEGGSALCNSFGFGGTNASVILST
jgi:3-oxoacyl-[acyl-carrier-protein] synthase II